MDIKKIVKAFEKNRYKVSFFEKKEAAVKYLIDEIKGKVVGFGDSKSISSMELFEELSRDNEVHDPAQATDNDEFLKIAKECLTTEVYLTSVNAATQSGEFVNIDGTGNRVAASLFGHEKVYFILGINKICKDLDSAIFRARNIAAPKNAKRLGLNTPCAIKADKCYNCASKDRICNVVSIYQKKMNDIEEVEVILVDEDLGL